MTGGCNRVYQAGAGCRQWGPERKEYSSFRIDKWQEMKELKESLKNVRALK